MTVQTNSITIAPLDAEDLAAVLRLLARCGLPEAGLAGHAATTLAARDGREIIGSAALELYGDVALLRSVAVDPALHQSEEFTHACPASAQAMCLTLAR